MNDDEVTPMQMSLGMAPERPMRPVPRTFTTDAPGGARWEYCHTAVSGKGWHVVARRRGSSGLITTCGLGGHKVKSLAKSFDPCPDCLATVSR